MPSAPTRTVLRPTQGPNPNRAVQASTDSQNENSCQEQELTTPAARAPGAGPTSNPPSATEEATDSPWNSRLDTLDLTFHRSSSCRTGPMPSAPIRRMSARRAETKPRTVQALTDSKPCNHQYLAFKACCIQLPASNRCEGTSTATKPGFLTSLVTFRQRWEGGRRKQVENRSLTASLCKTNTRFFVQE